MSPTDHTTQPQPSPALLQILAAFQLANLSLELARQIASHFRSIGGLSPEDEDVIRIMHEKQQDVAQSIQDIARQHGATL